MSRASSSSIAVIDNTLSGKIVDDTDRVDGAVIYFDLAEDKYKHAPVDPATGVPYSGAILDVDLGAHSLTTESVIFNDTPTVTPADRELFWDVDNDTLAFGIPDGGIIQINQEPFDYYLNLEGSQIVNGDIVSVTGAASTKTAVVLCDATDDTLARSVIGMVTVATINNNQVGRITKNGGKVRGLNTDAYTEGDTLYVDPLNPGKWTNVMPTAPTRAVKIGVVTVKSLTVGVVELQLDVHCKLTELADVNGTPLTTLGQIAVWHQSTGVFDFDYNITHLPSQKIGGVSDYTEFEADGTLKFVGAATVFVDELGDVTGLQQTGAGISTNTTESSVEYLTSANTSDYLETNIQLNHYWKIGSVIYPHVHWWQVENNTPNWLLQYRWQQNGGAKTTAWTNYKMNTNAFTYTSGTLNQISHDLGITPPVGAGLSDIVQIRLIRDTTNASGVFAGADPYTVTASVTSIDIHLEIDAIGSRSEYTK